MKDKNESVRVTSPESFPTLTVLKHVCPCTQILKAIFVPKLGLCEALQIFNSVCLDSHATESQGVCIILKVWRGISFVTNGGFPVIINFVTVLRKYHPSYRLAGSHFL